MKRADDDSPPRSRPLAYRIARWGGALAALALLISSAGCAISDGVAGDGGDDFGCDCGNGTEVPEEFLCDGADDCGNGADEMCPLFDCGNGDSVPVNFACDGLEDCVNGEDEVDCPLEVECGNGEFAPPEFFCDGVEDCTNGGDEIDCPALICV